MRSGKAFLLTIALLSLSDSLFSQKIAHKHDLTNQNLQTHETVLTSNGSRFLSNASIQHQYNLAEKVPGADHIAIAKNFLLKNAPHLGFEFNQESLNLSKMIETPAGSYVSFEQTINGIPVFDSRTTVVINKLNEVTAISSHRRPYSHISGFQQNISETEAIQIALNHIKPTGSLTVRETARFMIFESIDRGFEPAWKINFSTSIPSGAWEIFVNSEDGRIIQVQDKMMHRHGIGMVWDPDPLSSGGYHYGGNYADNDDSDTPELNREMVPVILPDLGFENGLYKLEGPYVVLADIEAPADSFPQFADSSRFTFSRSEQGFEAVMAYYHIDRSTRRLIDLGYEIPEQLKFKVDPHGLEGADNSHYDPNGNYVAFGEGGVDDAEDADVIWHEHAHSFQQNFTGGMSYSGETRSLQEGCADYWAASYSRSLNLDNWGLLYNWDGNNEYWTGRRCDTDLIYPDDYQEGYTGGQIWCSALMKIWTDLGRDITDQLFLESHFIWGYSPGLNDAAMAFLQADRNLFDGAHLSIILEHFETHGLVSRADYLPDITHKPLPDNENLSDPYAVNVKVIPTLYPLKSGSVKLIYTRFAKTDTLVMELNGNTNEYSAYIPADGETGEFSYYVSAADSGNYLSFLPGRAPFETFSFYTGPDTVAPSITHGSPGNQALSQFPLNIEARVSDNCEVYQVECIYYLNTQNTMESFLLESADKDYFIGELPVDESQLSVGDTIFYRIKVKDIAAEANYTTSPKNGFHFIRITGTVGNILVISDQFNGKKGSRLSKTDNAASSAISLKSTVLIQRILEVQGFRTTLKSASEVDDIDPAEFDLIISSSGNNENPVQDEDYRVFLEDWLDSDPAHKLLIEGGELGYVAARSPGYPSFLNNVLHCESWSADNAGSLIRTNQYNDHPAFQGLHGLPDRFSLDYQTFRDQDSQKPLAPAYSLYENSQNPGHGGVIIYDNNDDLATAQLAYFSFNFSALNDSLGAVKLLGNIVSYLLTPEPSTSEITGNIDPDENTLPHSFKLEQNFPNPFNPSTTISYQLAGNSMVYLEVFNIIGQRVAMLVNQPQTAGSHSVSWNATDNHGTPVPAGVYVYRLKAGSFTQIKKMIFTK